MKLIKPAEISAKIMTLIDEAEKELIIVSPYNNITGWNKLINRIKKAQSKGVKILWFSRKNNVDTNNSDEVAKNLGIKPFLIDDLHAKIYMNEESAIFTSMNMSKISDDKSLDIGYITEKKEEFDEIQNFYRKHIKNLGNNNEVGNKPNEALSTKHNPREIISTTNSDEKYVKVIHEYIHFNYGSYSYNKNGELLEYYQFPEPGYKAQFVPYKQAISVHFYLPPSDTLKKIEKRITGYSEYKKLYKKSELKFSQEGNQVYIKYYFEMFNQELESWGLDNFKQFFKNFDIIINAIKKTDNTTS